MKKIIYGYGITGKALKTYFDKNNISYYIVDKKCDYDIVSSPLNFDCFEECDEIYVSPGISLNDDFVLQCSNKGISVTSELEKAYSILKNSKFIAVTGTNGKSTVCALIYEIFKNYYKDVYICGNFGIPLIEFSEKSHKNNIFIIELSSYQLESLKDFTPDISILLNLTPDHLGRHKTFENYRLVKQNIFKNMKNGIILYNNSDFSVDNVNPDLLCKVIGEDFRFKDKVFINKDKKIQNINSLLVGPHNDINISFAVETALCMNIPDDIIKSVIERFPGLEHRIEFCGDINGIKIYNDSKSTTFESTYAAVDSFHEKVNLIICGNLKEGMDIDLFIKNISQKNNIKDIYVVGKINSNIDNNNYSNIIVYEDYSMKCLFEELLNRKDSDEILLFSPGMPSFDNFANFEQRGKFFKDKVKEFLSEKEKEY